VGFGFVKKFIFIAAIFSFFFVSPPAFACEPCSNSLSFDETLSKADLIIIGQKVAEGPRSDFGEGYGGSDWIEVKVIEILKGSIPNKEIKINSWDAMCPYGIVVDDNRNYLMLLQKKATPGEDYQYDSVDSGCAERSYLVENNQIDLDGQKTSLEDLASKYGLQIQKNTVDNTGLQVIDSNKDYVRVQDSSGDILQKQSLVQYYILFGFAALIILVFVLLKAIRNKR
jgi:hypothetical protein